MVVLLPADPALPVSGVRVHCFVQKKKLNDIFCYIIFDGPIDLLHKKDYTIHMSICPWQLSWLLELLSFVLS